MAQVTRAAHASSVATKLADNTGGDISAQDVREVITDLEDSVPWYDEAVSFLSGITTTGVTPASGDKILLLDASDSDNLRHALFSTFGGGGGDSWGDVVDANIVPDADGARNIGSTGTRFGHIYADNLTLTDAVTVTGGPVDFQADVTLGFGLGDDVSVNGTIVTDILPGATNNEYIGNNTRRWTRGYFDQIYVTEGIVLTEAADHPITPAAGEAQLWIDNTATQTVQVTFDDGTDAEVLTNASGGALSEVTVAYGDAFFIADSSDSDNAKTANVQTTFNAHEINAQTGTTYTAVLGDRASTVTMSNASANTFTLPANSSVAYPTGTVINVIQLGAGTTSIEGDTGVTINGVSAGSGDINNQYQGVSCLKIATDTWIISGDIGTVA